MSEFIDLSYANSGAIDFAQVKASGRTAAYLKATGSQAQLKTPYVDSKYRLFEQNARAAGLAIGHYHFNGDAVTPEGAADFFISNLANYQSGDRLGLDVEPNAPQAAWTPAKALAFAQRVESHVGKPIDDIYLNLSLLRGGNWQPLKDLGVHLWFAGPGIAPTGLPYWGDATFHQYATAAVSGAGSVDVDQTVGSAVWSPVQEDDDMTTCELVKIATDPTVYYSVNRLQRYAIPNETVLANYQYYMAQLPASCCPGGTAVQIVDSLPSFGAIVVDSPFAVTATVDEATLATDIAAKLSFPTLAEIQSAAGTGARAAIIRDPAPTN